MGPSLDLGREMVEMGPGSDLGAGGRVAQPALARMVTAPARRTATIASRVLNGRHAEGLLESGLAARCRRAPPQRDKADFMGWILLEAAVALAIGLAIVWWTWPAKGDPKDDDKR